MTHHGLSTANPFVYLPLAQASRQGSHVVVRTEGDPLNYVGAERAAVRSFDADQPIEDIQTLDRRLAQSIARDRFSAITLGLSSILAVTLAAIGLYGVLSYATARRTQEMAIRVALGAERRDVLKLVLRQGMMPAAAGIVIGLAGALALGRFIERLLYGIPAYDPSTLSAVTLLLALIAILACWIPARRAMRMDPIAALRDQ